MQLESNALYFGASFLARNQLYSLITNKLKYTNDVHFDSLLQRLIAKLIATEAY